MNSDVALSSNGSGTGSSKGDRPTTPDAMLGGDRRRGELLELYKLAFDESKFQINLNWDRTKHYFLFNVAVFTIAGGLHHLGPQSKIPQLALFAFAAIHSFFSAYSIRKGHEYYRAIRKRSCHDHGAPNGDAGADRYRSHRGVHRASARKLNGV
jgi:hypothetical protein